MYRPVILIKAPYDFEDLIPSSCIVHGYQWCARSLNIVQYIDARANEGEVRIKSMLQPSQVANES